MAPARYSLDHARRSACAVASNDPDSVPALSRWPCRVDAADRAALRSRARLVAVAKSPLRGRERCDSAEDLTNWGWDRAALQSPCHCVLLRDCDLSWRVAGRSAGEVGPTD